MGAKIKLIIVLFFITAVWFGALMKLGIWRATMTPADGYLSRTFEGWEKYPASRHLFLVQTDANGFAEGRPYVSGTYPSIFFYFLFLAPFHFFLGLPYNIAHNFLSYFFVLCVTILLILATRKQLLAISKEKRFLLWFLAFISIGISITDPLPWTSSFNANRDNAHIVTAGLFCYLSTFVFHKKVPSRQLFVVGIFLALWAPTCIPAWILAGLFFQRTLKLERKWLLQVVGVCALGLLNVALPTLVSRLAGMKPGGSSLLSRSGLNGSTVYMTSIFQAVYSPTDPRHWPTDAYFLLTILLAVGFHYFFKGRQQCRPLQQAFFVLIPYLTFAIFLPQLTSIHPYTTDLFIFVPATFLISFWFLQKPFWESLTGKTYVAWFLVASLILMTNLLAITQMPRFAYVERTLSLLPAITFVSAGFVYLGLLLLKWLHHNNSNEVKAK